MEPVTYFILFGSKINADSDCSHEIRRRLLLCRKAMTNLDSVLKSRDITLPTEVHTVHGVAKSRTQLSFFHFHFQNHLKTVTAAMKLKDTCSLEGKL